MVGGGFGGRLSLDALARSPRFEPVAACDVREEARAALERDYAGLATWSNHRAMLDECPVDVVCVATHPPSHEAVTMDALRAAPRGIVVEKPLGETAEAGRRIVRAVRAAGIPVAVPHNLLVAPHAREVLARVRTGEIGDLILIEIQNRGWDIINAGIHWLNFAVTLLAGDPPAEALAQADATSRTHRDGMQVETLAVTAVQTRSGARVVMHTGDHTRVNAAGADGRSAECCFRLLGTRGWIEFHGWAPRYRVLNAAHPHGETYEVSPGARTGHQRHLEAMADQIAEGTADLGAAERSLLALELCEAAYRSAREGRAIPLPLGPEEPARRPAWDPGRPYGGTGGGRDGRRLDVEASA